MGLIRAFISIDIPENIQKEIKKIQEKLPKFEGRLTELENLHLTLKFLGEIDEEKIIEVKRRLKEIKYKTFEAKISEIGVFSPSYIKIVWLKMNNCYDIQRIIDKKLDGLFKKEERFMGHITIARVKRIKNKKYFLGQLKKTEIKEGLKFKVKSFELKKSNLEPEGPIHEVIEEYRLE